MLKKLKIALYRELLNTPVDSLSESEIELMAILAGDRDIQEALN